MKRYESYLIYLPILVLFFFSVINLYNARYLNVFYANYYLKQIIWYLLGIITIFLLKKINVKNLFKFSKYLYYINLLLLLLVLFIGEEINGTKAWIDLKIFTFQPSEFMKISLTLYLIEVASKKENKFHNICRLTIYTLLPSLLVFLEPDTGAIIFYLIIYFFIATTKKIKWYYYLIFVALAFLFISLFIYYYIFDQDLLIKLIGTSFFYRVERIINFKNNNYQLELALLSIFGSPILRNGINNILLYIPEGATDFIFAFCIGNFGFGVGIIIIICYGIFLIGLTKKIKPFNTKKTNYFVISFLLILFSQILINISMNIGLIPIVGITLPFLSYGGSSIIVCFIFLAITLKLTNKDNYIHKERSKNKNNHLRDDKD